jgi:triacylglycerol esterase/lipase EstA (alpha/beta hydrolase family)
MKSKKSISSLFILRFPLLLTLFCLFTLGGCAGGNSSIPQGKKDKPGADGRPGDKKVVLVLLHGLNYPKDPSISDLGKKLSQDIKNAEVIILNRYNSGSASTAQQAEETYRALKERMEQKKLADVPVCILGSSQGGLVTLELYRTHKDDLNIKGVIANHTPLEGVPSLNTFSQAVDTFKNAVQVILTDSGDAELMKIAPSVGKINFVGFLTKKIKPVVIQDLTKGSPLLQNIESTLSTIDIPVLILAGKVDIKSGMMGLLQFASNQYPLLKIILPNFKTTLNKVSPTDLENLEAAFGMIVGDKENDCFIPYYSQMGEHISKSPKIISKTHVGYTHFDGISKDPKAYSDILEFIKGVMDIKK